jgi:gas vesicle protein
MKNDYGIRIDETTSLLLRAIANVEEDDPLVLATLAEIDADEFRQFMAECGEDSKEALQLLEAAEFRERVVRERRNRLGHYGTTGPELSTVLACLLIGSSIGAILALLLAPKSGEELRGDTSDAARRSLDHSREAAQGLVDRASELYSQAAEKVSEAATRQTGTGAAAIDARNRT